MPQVLEMKQRKSIEDKVNKYKGLERVLFFVARGKNGPKNVKRNRK